MPTVDSLDIQISSSVQKANTSIDTLVKKLDILADSISAIEKNSGIDNFSKKIVESTKWLSKIQNTANGFSKSMEPQMQKVSKTLEQITEQYKNLGKGFTFKGSASEIQKQIDKYTNGLETAKLKKEELETAGKTEGKAYEAAVAKTIEYTNVIKSLKQQLADVKAAQPQFNFNISGIEETRQAIESVGESIRESVSLPESAFNYNAEAMTAAFGEAAANVQNYTQAVEQFGRNAGMVLNESPQLGRLNEESQAAAEGIKVLGERLSRLTVPEVREENLGKLQSELDKTEIKLDELRVKLENGLTMGNITESIDSSGYVRLREQIALTERQAEALREKIAEVEIQSGSSGGIERFWVAFEKLAPVGKTVKSALSGVASTLGKIGSTVKNVMSGITKLAKSLSGLGKSSKATNVSLAGGFKTVLKYAFGIRSLYVLFNKLRNAIKEGMKNLVQYSSETNASVSLLNNSMNQLKNASAAMVAPMINAVFPALNQIIQLCTRAENAINQFLSALSGKSTWIKAKIFTDNYADSISKLGKASKGALRPFDELKTITTQDNGGVGETSAADMFETAEIDDNFKNLAERLKEMAGNADFAEIGEILGIRLKRALDSVSWNKIKKTARKIGKSLATLINGFAEVPGLAYSIGKTIGDSINTGIAGINSFLDKTHWNSVGRFIGEGLNGIVNTVDWVGVGHLFAAKINAIFEVIGNLASTFDWSNFGLQLATSVNTFITDFDWAENGARLGELAKGLLDSIISFLENTNWQELGNGIADFIGGIDWGGILERLAEGIGAALGGLAALIWGLIEDAWGNVVTWWEETAFEDGKFTIAGLLNGIWEGIKNIGTWIYEHIFKPFIDGFKNAFGIHSPSKVMGEMGGYLIEGLLIGLKNAWINVVHWIEDKAKWLAKKVKGMFDSVVGSLAGTITFNSSLTNSSVSGAMVGFGNLERGISTYSMASAMDALQSKEIPGYAKGQVIPRTMKKHLAFLGDNNQETEIVSPLSTIKKALWEELTKFAEKAQAAMPNTRLLGYNYESAPVPSIAGAYGNYQYDTSAYTGSYNNNHSDMSNAIEMTVYNATYNAVSSAIGNSSTLGDIKDLIEKGRVIEMDGREVSEIVRKHANDYMRAQGKPYFAY